MALTASMIASHIDKDSFTRAIGRVTRSLSRTPTYWEIFFYVALFWLSTWIMFKTFSYDYETNRIMISPRSGVTSPRRSR